MVAHELGAGLVAGVGVGVGAAVGAGVGAGAGVGVGVGAGAAVGAVVGAGAAVGAGVGGAAVGAGVGVALGLAMGADDKLGIDVALAVRDGDGVEGPGDVANLTAVAVGDGAVATSVGLPAVVDVPAGVDAGAVDVAPGVGGPVTADMAVMSGNAGADLPFSALPLRPPTFVVVARPALAPSAKIWDPAANIAPSAMIATPTRRTANE